MKGQRMREESRNTGGAAKQNKMGVQSSSKCLEKCMQHKIGANFNSLLNVKLVG